MGQSGFISPLHVARLGVASLSVTVGILASDQQVLGSQIPILMCLKETYSCPSLWFLKVLFYLGVPPPNHQPTLSCPKIPLSL